MKRARSSFPVFFTHWNTSWLETTALEEFVLFLLDGLDQLEKIEIRTKSFTLSKDYQDAYYSTRRDGSCRIRNCSFCDCCSFELSNLHILDIGENCFYNAISFILAGWCNNTSVLLRLWRVFLLGTRHPTRVKQSHLRVSEKTSIADLPQLHTIQVGSYAIRGNWDNERKQLKKEPHRFLNTMTMKSGLFIIVDD